MQLSFQDKLLEAGCDEAGRGCLAGSVFAAAVILPKDFFHPQLNDSKKMSEKSRYKLREIIETSAIAWAVAEVSAQRIDEINILNASFEAMNIAVSKLQVTPELLLIDGPMFRTLGTIPYECMVKGDARFMNIAAASVLAKTYRDDYMAELNKLYPNYGWAKSKGYPTKAHREAIQEHGLSPYHRKSFIHNK
ncbi:MAG: ribonuclease HII [Rikenellaceae bacterium]